MWSPYYDYYEIRSSVSYDLVASTEAVRAQLDAMPELERVGMMNYKNAAGHPWIDLTLARGQNGNFNCANDTWHEAFNMISIVCSKSESGHIPASQIVLLIKIAQLLGWELINDENDVSEENVVVWKP